MIGPDRIGTEASNVAFQTLVTQSGIAFDRKFA
jgi:hypothetical protein